MSSAEAREISKLLFSRKSDERLARFVIKADAAIVKEVAIGRTSQLSLEQCDRYEIELCTFVELYVMALREQAKRKEARA